MEGLEQITDEENDRAIRQENQAWWREVEEAYKGVLRRDREHTENIGKKTVKEVPYYYKIQTGQKREANAIANTQPKPYCIAGKRYGRQEHRLTPPI